jgi:hypothetical protein
MVVAVLIVYVILHTGLFAYSFSWGEKSSKSLLFVRFMLLALVYDNAMLAIAPWFIDSELFLLLNYPRYVLHAAILPFLSIFTLTMMQLARIALANQRWFISLCWIITALTLCYGIIIDVANVRLGSTEVMGYVRLINLDGKPPFATIATNLFVIPLAALLWIRAGWKWLCLGALFSLFINAGFGSQPWGSLAGNGAEVVFVFAVLMTEKYFRKAKV